MSVRSSMQPLRIPGFRALWAASVVSNIGSFLQAVAASWLMLEMTGSPFWVGLMAASSTLPLLFLSLPAGAIADLFDRRRVLLVAQSIMGVAAVAMAVTAMADVLSPGLLLALGLLLGVGLAINLPAWQALVPDLVPRGLVASAVALNSVSFNVARAVGPALGGLIVATLGAGAAFAVNSVTYVGILGVLAGLQRRWQPEDVEPVGTAIATGLRFARFTPAFRRLIAVVGAFAMTSAVVQSLLPNVTAEALGGDAALYGVLLGAMGAGALVAAFTRDWAQLRLGRAMVPLAMTGFGLAGIVVGVSRTTPLTVGAMATAGVFWVWALSTLNATVQLLAPAWVRGRAMSLYTLAFVGLLPLGSIFGGAMGAAMGSPQAVATLSVATVFVGFAGLRYGVPRLGEHVSTEPPSDWDLEPHDAYLEGGPVMVANTWTISKEDLDGYLAAMAELRLVRLTTGAFRWRLYRDAGDPHRMTELMLLASWDDHLRQHRRIDLQAAGVIRTAAAFDRAGGPESRHLVAVEVADAHERPAWESLVAVHRDLHRSDGSIPLREDGAVAVIGEGAVPEG